jgi:S1-C subfamily serine protease
MLEIAPKTQTKLEYIRDGKNNSVNVTVEEAAPMKPKSQTKVMPFDGKDGDIFGDTPNLKDLQDKLRKQMTPDSLGQDDVEDVAPLKNGKVKLGVGIENLTPENRKKNNIPSSIKGVLVGTIESDSVAAKNGIKPGDVIETIGGKKVETVNQLSSEVAHLSWGGKVNIKVHRFEKDSEMTFEKDIRLK